MILKEIIHSPERGEETLKREEIKAERETAMKGGEIKIEGGRGGRNPHPVGSENTSVKSHSEMLIADR